MENTFSAQFQAKHKHAQSHMYVYCDVDIVRVDYRKQTHELEQSVNRQFVPKLLEHKQLSEIARETEDIRMQSECVR